MLISFSKLFTNSNVRSASLAISKSLARCYVNNLDILLISETEIDSSFPFAQFQIEGYTTCRLDRNANGGGIPVYIREDIPSTLLNSDMSIEGFYIEMNIRKKMAFSLHVKSK